MMRYVRPHVHVPLHFSCSLASGRTNTRTTQSIDSQVEFLSAPQRPAVLQVASKVERKIAADIRFRLAKAFLLPGDTLDLGKAGEALNDAIKYDKEHTEAIMELAKLCVKANDLSNAQQNALKLLTIDENNIEASLLIADIMFRKTEYKAAVYHLQQMLIKTPDNYEVLCRLVSVLWRSGTLTDAREFIRRARRSSPRAVHAAGYNFCKGLYFALASDPVKAITFLNLARRDGEWGRRAIERMILIYLNPTGVPMWEDSEEIREDAGEAIRVIESLLREPPMHPRTEYVLPNKFGCVRACVRALLPGACCAYCACCACLMCITMCWMFCSLCVFISVCSFLSVHCRYHEVLQCYSDMLTRSKTKIDEVAHMCLKINERNKNFVPALLCMATAFMLNKQIPKARNQLKRISKLPYDPEYASDFENAYLMLSGIYIRTKKFDLALQLCKRCLEHNKSCGKAWEDMGLIMEKETSYKDAAMYVSFPVTAYIAVRAVDTCPPVHVFVGLGRCCRLILMPEVCVSRARSRGDVFVVGGLCNEELTLFLSMLLMLCATATADGGGGGFH